MTRSGLIDITLIIHHETSPWSADNGAILASDDGNKARAVWLPKCAIEIERKHGHAIVTMPERLAKDKGLI